VTARRKTKLLALDAQDFHAPIKCLSDLAAHVHRAAKARLADTEQARKGDLAADEIAQAAHTDKPADD
jgi:voltage-gated potassium channel